MQSHEQELPFTKKAHPLKQQSPQPKEKAQYSNLVHSNLKNKKMKKNNFMECNTVNHYERLLEKKVGFRTPNMHILIDFLTLK